MKDFIIDRFKYMSILKFNRVNLGRFYSRSFIPAFLIDLNFFLNFG